MNMYVPLPLGMTARRLVLVALVWAILPGCATLFGQTDNFREEKLSAGCATVADCEQLVSAAWARHERCAPNEIGKVPCTETYKDYEAAKGLRDRALEAEHATAPPPTKLEPTSPPVPDEQDDAARAARQERARAIADEEIRTGRCDANKVKWLRDVGSWVDQIHSGDGNAVVSVDKTQFIVASDKPTKIDLASTLSGEYHVVAASFSPVKLSVSDGQGYVVEGASLIAEELGALAMGKAAIVGSAVRADTREELQASVTGYGCVLVMLVHRVSL